MYKRCIENGASCSLGMILFLPITDCKDADD